MVEKLITVDLTQFNFKHNTDQIKGMLQALQDLKLESSLSLEEGLQRAAERLSEIGVQKESSDFMLLNLYKNADNKFDWYLNLESVRENLENILFFPQDKLIGNSFDGETLYIGGADSKYIPKKFADKVKDNFPNSSVAYIENAGHLVYEDQPDKLIEVVSNFFNLRKVSKL